MLLQFYDNFDVFSQHGRPSAICSFVSTHLMQVTNSQDKRWDDALAAMCPRFKSEVLTSKKLAATEEPHETASHSGRARTGQHSLRKTIVGTHSFPDSFSHSEHIGVLAANGSAHDVPAQVEHGAKNVRNFVTLEGTH